MVGERFFILMFMVFLLWFCGLLYTPRLNPHLKMTVAVTDKPIPKAATKPGGVPLPPPPPPPAPPAPAPGSSPH